MINTVTISVERYDELMSFERELNEKTVRLIYYRWGQEIILRGEIDSIKFLTDRIEEIIKENSELRKSIYEFKLSKRDKKKWFKNIFGL